MMRNTIKYLTAALLAQLLPATAHAAPRTIAAGLTAIVTPIEAIRLPVLGRLGSVSIGTVGDLPGLSKIKVPLFGTLSGLPEVGTLTVADGLGLVESIAVLQHPLQGFTLGKPLGLLRP